MNIFSATSLGVPALIAVSINQSDISCASRSLLSGINFFVPSPISIRIIFSCWFVAIMLLLATILSFIILLLTLIVNRITNTFLPHK